MFTEQELHAIEIYESEGLRKEIDDFPLEADPLAVKTFTRLRKPGRVVDIGCGHGRAISVLPDMGISSDLYIGIDPSPAQVALASERYPNLTFEVGDIYSMGDAYPACFDGFWCCMMLMHIPRDRLTEALCGLRKSLKLHAIGVIATPSGAGERYHEDGMQIILYEPKVICETLEKAGFRSTFYCPDPTIQVISVVAV